MIDIDALDFSKGDGLVTVVCQDRDSGAVLMVAHGNRESLERTIATGEMHYWSRTRGLWHKGATSGNTQRVVELRYDCDADAILAQVLPSGPACHTGSETCFGSADETAGILARLDGVIGRRAEGAVRRSAGGPSDGRTVASEGETLRAGAPGVGNSTSGSVERQRTAASDIDSSHEDPPGGGNSTDAPGESHRISAGNAEETHSYTVRLLRDRNLRLKKLGEETAELVTACADGDRQRATEEAADLIYHTLVAIRATGASLRDVEDVLGRRHSAAR